MSPIVTLAPTGCLGCGFDSAALKRGMSMSPHVVATDAGSSDSGPYYLGTGRSLFSKAVLKKQAEEILLAARKAGVPFIIGSSCTAGARPHVDKLSEIILEIAREHDLHFPMARIYADIGKDVVKKALANGQIRDFEANFKLTPQLVDQSTGLVAQMGYEPIVNALEQGAEVIVAGRACDDMALGAFAIWKGADLASAIHMGKILECGAFASEPFAMDVMVGTIDGKSFVLEPGNLKRRATVQAVAGHALYEREDPFTIEGPGAALDLKGCSYEQINDRQVRVSGAVMNKSDYCIKLEGAKLAGYRSSALVGVRCPSMLKRLDDILEAQHQHAVDAYQPHKIHVRFLQYGRDAIMGSMEPERNRSVHEIGVLIDVVADSQDVAHDACNFIALELQHVGYPGQKNNAANLAFPYSPRETDAGPIYEWSAYHLMNVTSPTALFPVELEKI